MPDLAAVGEMGMNKGDVQGTYGMERILEVRLNGIESKGCYRL